MINGSKNYKRKSIFSLALILMHFMNMASFAQDKAETHQTFINMEFTNLIIITN